MPWLLQPMVLRPLLAISLCSTKWGGGSLKTTLPAVRLEEELKNFPVILLTENVEVVVLDHLVSQL